MSDLHGPFYFKGTHKGDEWTYEFTIDLDTRKVDAKLYKSKDQSGWFKKMKEKLKGFLKKDKADG